jgi:hypothetical protein
MLQIQHIPNIITRPQHRIHILFRMRRTHTEPHAARHERRRRVRHHHHDNRGLALFHHAVEHPHLPRVEQQERHDRRRGVPVRDEAEFFEPLVEVPRVKREAAEPRAAFSPGRERLGEAQPCGEGTDGCGAGVHALIFDGGGGGGTAADETAAGRRHEGGDDAHDAGHAGDDLHEHWWCHGFGVGSCVPSQS